MSLFVAGGIFCCTVLVFMRIHSVVSVPVEESFPMKFHGFKVGGSNIPSKILTRNSRAKALSKVDELTSPTAMRVLHVCYEGVIMGLMGAIRALHERYEGAVRVL